MRRKEVTPAVIEEVVRIFATTIFGTEWVQENSQGELEYPLTWLLLTKSPESVAKHFATGNLTDLQRVAGVAWSWYVAEDDGELRITFYRNVAARERTEEDKRIAAEITNQVMAYLSTQTRE